MKTIYSYSGKLIPIYSTYNFGIPYYQFFVEGETNGSEN